MIFIKLHTDVLPWSSNTEKKYMYIFNVLNIRIIIKIFETEFENIDSNFFVLLQI